MRFSDPPVGTEGWGCEVDPGLWPPILGQQESWVQRGAQRDGVALLLSGWGGDEGASFNGRGIAVGAWARGDWVGLARHFNLGTVAVRPRRWRGLAARIQFELVRPWWNERRRSSGRGETHWGAACLRSEWRRQVESGVIDAPRDRLRETLGAPAYQWALIGQGHLAERMAFWAATGARHGLSYAYPLADRRVLEFAVGVPPELHAIGGWLRHLFRCAMEPVLPPGFVWEAVKLDTALLNRVQASRRQAWPGRRLALEQMALACDDWIDVPHLRRKLLATNQPPRESVLWNLQVAMEVLTARSGTPI